MIFCDFGEDFTVYDVDGEQPISNMVAGIDRVNILLQYFIFRDQIQLKST